MRIEAFDIQDGSRAHMWRQLLEHLPEELKDRLGLCVDPPEDVEQDKPCLGIDKYGQANVYIRTNCALLAAQAETRADTAHTAIYIAAKVDGCDDWADLAGALGNDEIKQLELRVFCDEGCEDPTQTYYLQAETYREFMA